MNGSTPGLPVHHQLPEFTQLHKLKKKLQKRFEHKNGQKDIEQQLATEKILNMAIDIDMDLCRYITTYL